MEHKISPSVFNKTNKISISNKALFQTDTVFVTLLVVNKGDKLL